MDNSAETTGLLVGIQGQGVIASDKPCFPYRFKLAALSVLGYAAAMSLRVNFNIALVAMVNYTSENTMNQSYADTCPDHNHYNHSSTEQQGDFNWDPKTQSLLLGGFFYGYIFTQFPGGYLAQRFGATKLILAAVLGSGLINLLIPIVAKWDVKMLVVLRILMGLMQGPLYPANYALWGQWAPVFERSQIISWINVGSISGMVISMSLTGYLCSLTFMGGWPLTFYLYGIVSIIWSIAWFLAARDSPAKHTGLSRYEREYLANSTHTTGSSSQSQTTPWVPILTSKATWAIYLYSVCDSISYYTLFTGVPIYMKQVLKFDITQEGFTAAVPFIAMGVTSLMVGPIADCLRQKRILTTTAVRKLFVIIGEGSTGIILIGMAYVTCDKVPAMAVYSLAFAAGGLGIVGAPCSVLDISPRFAGTVMGIANVFANLGGFLSPMIVSLITGDTPNKVLWQYVFYYTIAVYILGTISFVLLGSGEEQPWSKTSSENEPIVTTVEDDNHYGAINS